MNILIIKQTSLGDVLHATGHVRTIRESYPDAHITLLTASTSSDLFKHCSYLDEIIEFDRYRVKFEWWRKPVATWRHIRDVGKRVRQRKYDLALDLQGAIKSVVFLYTCNATRRIVKGSWPRLDSVQDESVHAIKEMDLLLKSADIACPDTSMQLYSSDADRVHVDQLLAQLNPRGRPVVLISPYTRWNSKDWPRAQFAKLAKILAGRARVFVTGAKDRSSDIDALVKEADHAEVMSLAGNLNLMQFAEFVRRADLVVSGDSFPMHLASAANVRQVAIFGPTNERRVGPTGTRAVVVRPDDKDCQRCPKARRCKFDCINEISLEKVRGVSDRLLDEI